MAQKHRFHNTRQKTPRKGSPAAQREAIVIPERKAPIVYGEPFILLEDDQKNTFEYRGGAWVPFEMTIAQCRSECQVNVLPQKVNRMSRYEIRRALPAQR